MITRKMSSAQCLCVWARFPRFAQSFHNLPVAPRFPVRTARLSSNLSEAARESFLDPFNCSASADWKLASSSPSLRRARLRRILTIGSFSLFFTTAGFLIATAPAIASMTALMSAPSDAESLRLFHAPDEMAAEIDRYIENHPLSLALRADPAWTESKPHMRYPDMHKKHSLTAGTLLGPGKFPVPPTVFCDEKNLVSLAYVGTDLCGHVGIVHGGLLATMLDEGLGRLAFNSLPNKVGVTASLTVNYRNPAPAGSYLVLKGETVKVEGRKVWVKGRIEILNEDETPGQLLAEAEGLFIEPKYAKALPKLFQAQAR